MANDLARIPSGMRDILPEQMIKRQYVLDVVRSVFESFGFEPMQTSAIELSATLLGKYGEDAERLIYKAWYGDTPDGEFALRYDLSVPLSRVVAMYANDITRPFKRYQIAPVWRADRTAKGRYREFYQCDVDIVGSPSMLADAEVVAVIYHVLHRLGFTEFVISINHRKLLDGIAQYAGVPEHVRPELYRSIDKMDKIGLDGVRDELLLVGIPKSAVQPLQHTLLQGIQGKIAPEQLRDHLVSHPQVGPALAEAVHEPLRAVIAEGIAENIPGSQLQARSTQLVGRLAPALRTHYAASGDIIPTEALERLLELLQVNGEAAAVLDQLEMLLGGIPSAQAGISELRTLFECLAALSIPDQVVRLNFAMVRGLAYYTGPIFETTVTRPVMPSISGGGRYDNLIGLFAETSQPVTGVSLGIERIIDVMTELDMFPPSLRAASALALVTVFDQSTALASLRLAADLRLAGINTSVFFDADQRLGEQIGYAVQKGIPFVLILGPDELAAGQVTIRHLAQAAEAAQQQTIPLDKAAQALLNWPV